MYRYFLRTRSYQLYFFISKFQCVILETDTCACPQLIVVIELPDIAKQSRWCFTHGINGGSKVCRGSCTKEISATRLLSTRLRLICICTSSFMNTFHQQYVINISISQLCYLLRIGTITSSQKTCAHKYRVISNHLGFTPAYYLQEYFFLLIILCQFFWIIDIVLL